MHGMQARTEYAISQVNATLAQEMNDDEWEAKHAARNSYLCWEVGIRALRRRYLEARAMDADEKLSDFISELLMEHTPDQIISALELRLMAMKEEYDGAD